MWTGALALVSCIVASAQPRAHGRAIRLVAADGLDALTIAGDSPVGGHVWSSAFTTSQLRYNITMPKWTKEVTIMPVSSGTPPGKISVQTLVRRAPPPCLALCAALCHAGR